MDLSKLREGISGFIQDKGGDLWIYLSQERELVDLSKSGVGNSGFIQVKGLVDFCLIREGD